MSGLLSLIGVPNPWVLLATLLALIGAYWGGNYEGHKAERLAWTAREQKLIADNLQKAREQEQTWAYRNANIEKDYLNADAKANTLRTALDTAVARGVRLKGACQQSVSATPTAPGGIDSAPSSDGILPEQIGRDLVDLARSCERTLGIAHAGQDYAVDR